MISPPIKPKNKERRSREFLSSGEIDKLIKTARDIGWYGHRDATMILIAFRHGLRVSELVSLRWSQFDLKHGLFHVVRRKNSIDSTHPLAGVEMRALQKMRRENPGAQFVFLSERKAPMTDSAFRKILYRTGEEAKLGLPVHPHMLRHSCGFKLANDAKIPEVSNIILATRTFKIPYLIRKSVLADLKIFGRIKNQSTAVLRSSRNIEKTRTSIIVCG